MAHDALDPGPNGDYPHFPRKADGSPAWSDRAETDGVAVLGMGGRMVAPMPRGIRTRTNRRGEVTYLNVTPMANGQPVNPPTLPV